METNLNKEQLLELLGKFSKLDTIGDHNFGIEFKFKDKAIFALPLDKLTQEEVDLLNAFLKKQLAEEAVVENPVEEVA